MKYLTYEAFEIITIQYFTNLSIYI